jgi:uncharacterized protein (DUF2062 family)
MFIGLTPTGGFQMALVLLFALLVRPLFRFNKTAALLTVYVSNPLTMVPILWLDYQVGTWIVPGSLDNGVFDRVEDLTTALDLIVEVGWPMVVGSLVVAALATVVTYPLIRWFLHVTRRAKRPPRAAEPNALAVTVK